MIQKLRRRLTALVIVSLMLIAVGIVLAINYANMSNIRRQMYASLETLMENEGQRPGSPQDGADRFDETPPPTPEGQTGGMDETRMQADETPPLIPENPQENDRQPDEARGDRGTNDPQRRPGQPEGTALASLSNSYTVWLDEDGAVEEWTSDREDLYSDEQIAELAAQIWAEGETRGNIGSQFYQMKTRPGGAMLVVVDARSEMANIRTLLMETMAVTALAFMLLAVGAALLIGRMLCPVEEAFVRQRQFVWDASHELKTPLAVISANADVLADEIGANEYLGYIRSEVARTNTLVENLLTLARMDSGTRKKQVGTFDLSRALLSVALPFESAVFEAGKTLEIDVPQGVDMRGDEEMVKQLAVILLGNALKYSDDGGQIRLSLTVRGNKRIITVWNTGEPIDKADQAKIFDRFYRADASHNREKQGNGLGLAIAQKIVEEHRGKIAVASSREAGTTFTVTLSE